LENKLPDPGASQLIFDQCLQVFQTGIPLVFSYFSQDLGKYISLTRTKVRGGVLTTARNRTEEYHRQREKIEQDKLLNSVIENSPYGICLYESVRDSRNNITDFKLRLCNKKSSEITALSLQQLQTMSVKELMAIRGHSGYFDFGVKVVETGEPLYTEYHSSARNQWLGFWFVKFADGYLLNYIDITQTKKFEQQAKKRAEELNAIFNGSVNAVYSAEIARNSENKITDLFFLRVNTKFQKMFPTLSHSLKGVSLSSVTGNDDQNGFFELITEASDTDKPVTRVLHYKNPDRWYELSVAPLGGEIISVTLNDITLEKSALLDIEHHKHLLDSIMKYSPNGLAITKAIRDEKGQMVDAITVLMNDSCEKLNGTPNDVVLSNTLGTLDPDLLTNPIFGLAARLDIGESFRTEYLLHTTGIWLAMAVARMDQDHFINVFTDISAIKQFQLQLESSIVELKRSNTNLGDFAYAASHDLQEPIRKIMIYSQQLKLDHADSLSESGLYILQRLSAATERMKKLIEDLLEYSWVNQGTTHVDEINLNDVLSNVIEDLEVSIREKNAQINLSNLPVILGNKRQFQQLFQNLLDNALKYYNTERKTAHLVTVAASTVLASDMPARFSNKEKANSYYLIQVTDNGIGFEPSDAERIFNVFVRLNGIAEYKGTGVGLSIVKKVVENHNGFIQAEGNPGVGATFSIYLPI
jgi:signal transduction histidine kinase